MKTESQKGLRIERRFDVPPKKVFDTLTKPDEMAVWWGENVDFDIDLRVGGHWTIVRRVDDMEYVATGEYLEVEEPGRLKYTYGMPQFSPHIDTIAIRIEADGEGSRIVFDHTGADIADEIRELKPGETSPSEIGWQHGFDLMADAWHGTA